MATILTGLFESQKQAAEISEALETAGIKNEDFIVYLHEKSIPKEVKTSVWRNFFGDKTVLEEESLVVTVRVREAGERDIISAIFNDNNASQINTIDNVRFSQAQSLEYLRRIVRLRARAQIVNTPSVRIPSSSSGMNSEVTFG